MFLDVTKYLNHTVQYWRVTKTRHGVTSASSVTTLSCFAYFGERELTKESPRRTSTQGWNIVFGTDARTLLTKGDHIRNLVDQDGVTVITSATVVSVAPYRHWGEGHTATVIEVE